jgi:DNA-binding IclR family transcriptional regulator
LLGDSHREETAMIRTCDAGTLITHIQDWFIAQPDLTLTLSETQRRCYLDRASCRELLAYLVEANVLTRTASGRYVRLFPRVVTRPAAGAIRRGLRPSAMELVSKYAA